jgi:hypothetical protein
MQSRSSSRATALIIAMGVGIAMAGFAAAAEPARSDQASGAPRGAEQRVERRTDQERIEGIWQVTSAAFQTPGPMYYLFTEDTLSIITVEVDKGGGEPRRPSTPQMGSYRYHVETSAKSRRMRLTPIAKSATRPADYVYEFRDGALWIAPDQADKTAAELLRPGGPSGWLVGLMKIGIVPEREKRNEKGGMTREAERG